MKIKIIIFFKYLILTYFIYISLKFFFISFCYINSSFNYKFSQQHGTTYISRFYIGYFDEIEYTSVIEKNIRYINIISDNAGLSYELNNKTPIITSIIPIRWNFIFFEITKKIKIKNYNHKYIKYTIE